MSQTLVKAVWAGPFPIDLPDGRTVQVGDTCQVDPANLQSAHWQPVPAADKPRRADR